MKQRVDIWVICPKCGSKKHFIGNPNGTTICFRCSKTSKVKKCKQTNGSNTINNNNDITNDTLRIN